MIQKILQPARTSFSTPLAPAVLLGSALTAVFYGLLLYGPLNWDLLRRYCLCHWVAEASVGLFSIAIVVLGFKWLQLQSQRSLTGKAGAVLKQIVKEGSEVEPAKRPQWLSETWLAQPTVWQNSWLGIRIREIVDRQIQRGKRSQVEQDMRSLAEADADLQHDSYGLVRIITWAMPMLGFLGTVLGISQTLGQLDTKLLATQQQEAMNQLTAGLYVAFDTTAIALVLTIVAMFIQFAISRMEVSLLARMDNCIQDCLIAFLGSDPHDAEKGLLGPVRQMAGDLVAAVNELVKQQAAIWSKSLSESQHQWSHWTESASTAVQSALTASLRESLENHAVRLEKIQDEGSRQIDARWQQWQITLSDQTRTLLAQQKEVARQTESLERLIESTCELKRLEAIVQENVASFNNLDLLQESAMCIGEAVAVLATSLERAGIIRGTPIKPRAIRKADLPDDYQQERRKAA